MRIVGVRNSPVGYDRAAAQRPSRPDSALDDSKNSRPLLYGRASECLDEKVAAQDPAPVSGDESEVRFLSANELLFGMGEPKSKLYVVETGALAVYEPRWNGHRAVIEFAFPGDLVGLGFLNTYACSARATTETRVRCLPLSAQDRLNVGDPRTQSRLADFELLKKDNTKAVSADKILAHNRPRQRSLTMNSYFTKPLTDTNLTSHSPNLT